MYRFLVLSVILASLSTVVGCGATHTRVADARDEACWQAPEEVAMRITDGQPKPGDSATLGANEKLKGSFRPNRNDRPVAGAVHAATY